MSTPADGGIFNIKDQKEYLGGFIGTGIMAIVQTVFPLLVYQLWKKDNIGQDVNNMWYQYAWQAAQANGVVSYGFISLAFLANFIFPYNLMERLSYIMLWLTHGGIMAFLGGLTVAIYLIVALSKYEMSAYSDETEMGLCLLFYGLIQIGFAILARYTMWDTIMYMVAGELKEICEKYGELCSEYGILEKKEDADQGSSEDISNLMNWQW